MTGWWCSVTIAEVRKGIAEMNGSLTTLEQTVEGAGLLAVKARIDIAYNTTLRYSSSPRDHENRMLSRHQIRWRDLTGIYGTRFRLVTWR